MRLQEERVTALTTENSAALAGIETEPQLTFDQDGIQQTKDQGNGLTASRFNSVTAVVPKQASYPAWFMAIGQSTDGPAALDLLTRSSSAKPWQLAVQTALQGGGEVKWKRAPGGWALATSPNGGPSGTLSDYWTSSISGGSGSGVAPGSMTSDVASQIKSKVSTNDGYGWAQVPTFTAGGSLPGAVELKDGTSLSFAWVNETLKTRDAYGGCFKQPFKDGSKWDPLVPSGNYLEVDLTYTYLEGMAIPPTGDIQALSYATGTTGVNVTQCSS